MIIDGTSCYENAKSGNLVSITVDGVILLCHELPGLKLNKNHFCHRRLLADYIELETGLVKQEININNDGIINKENVYDLKLKIRKIVKKY